MKGFTLPDKDVVVCFLALFYNVQRISFMGQYIQIAASRENIFGNGRLSSQKSWDLFGLFCQIEVHFAKCACMWKAGYLQNHTSKPALCLTLTTSGYKIIFHRNGQHWFTWIRHMAIIKH